MSKPVLNLDEAFYLDSQEIQESTKNSRFSSSNEDIILESFINLKDIEANQKISSQFGDLMPANFSSIFSISHINDASRITAPDLVKTTKSSINITPLVRTPSPPKCRFSHMNNFWIEHDLISQKSLNIIQKNSEPTTRLCWLYMVSFLINFLKQF